TPRLHTQYVLVAEVRHWRSSLPLFGTNLGGISQRGREAFPSSVRAAPDRHLLGYARQPRRPFLLVREPLVMSGDSSAVPFRRTSGQRNSYSPPAEPARCHRGTNQCLPRSRTE